MLERESGFGAQCVEIARRAFTDQDAGVVPLLNQLVVEGLPGAAQGHKPFRVGELLQQDCIDRGQAVLKIPQRTSRILYTSTAGAGLDTPYRPLAIHAATEAYLADSGVAWTALRNGFYGDLDQLLGPWQSTGLITKPADGPFSWVDRRDATEAAAAVLTGEATFDGPVDLTPQPPVTLTDFAAAASELTGRHIERVIVEDETWVADEVAHGVPEPVARFTLSMLQATRSGYFTHSDPTLAQLLGREPRSIADQLAELVSR